MAHGKTSFIGLLLLAAMLLLVQPAQAGQAQYWEAAPTSTGDYGNVFDSNPLATLASQNGLTNIGNMNLGQNMFDNLLSGNLDFASIAKNMATQFATQMINQAAGDLLGVNLNQLGLGLSIGANGQLVSAFGGIQGGVVTGGGFGGLVENIFTGAVNQLASAVVDEVLGGISGGGGGSSVEEVTTSAKEAVTIGSDGEVVTGPVLSDDETQVSVDNDNYKAGEADVALGNDLDPQFAYGSGYDVNYIAGYRAALLEEMESTDAEVAAAAKEKLAKLDEITV